MAYKDKADQAAAARRHYEKNKEAMKARAIEHRKKNTEIAKAFIVQVKSVLCADCQQYQPACAMQFDHVGDDKLFTIADKVSKGYSLETIKREIEKCEIVCANCHSIRTYTRRVGETMRIKKRQTPIFCEGNEGHWLYSYTFKDAELIWERDYCSECLEEMGVKF